METLWPTINAPLNPEDAAWHITPLKILIFFITPYILHCLGTWSVRYFVNYGSYSHFAMFKMIPIINHFSLIYYLTVFYDYLKLTARHKQVELEIDQKIQNYRKYNYIKSQYR